MSIQKQCLFGSKLVFIFVRVFVGAHTLIILIISYFTTVDPTFVYIVFLLVSCRSRTMTFRTAVVLGVVVVAAAACIAVQGQDSEHTCLSDGSHCSCRDDHQSCSYWQSLGEW
jgi:hypothetical protein